MGDVVPLREGAEVGPIDAAHAIGLAFQKAVYSLEFQSALAQSPGTRAVLLQRVDTAARGMRDVDRLCDDALAYLREGQATTDGIC
jgi:hypothetical protein